MTASAPAFGATATGRPSHRKARGRQGRLVHTIFAIPALVLVAGLVAYPLVDSFLQSLHAGNTFAPAGAAFVGLDNYVRFFSDPGALQIVANSFVRGVGGVVPSYILGLGAALALNRLVRGRTVVQVLVLVPFVISAPVGIAAWKIIFDPMTGIGPVVGLGGINPFVSETLVWPTLLLINLWGSFQFYSIILLAGLQRIPVELYEAASVDGANAWQRFFAVTWPSLSGLSAAVIALHFLGSFQEFNLVYLSTGGGPLNATQTMATYSYQVGFGGSYDLGYASAITFLSAIFMIVALAIAAGVIWSIVRVTATLKARATEQTMRAGAQWTGTRTETIRTLQRLRARKRITVPGWVTRITRWVVVAALVGFSLFPALFLLSRSLDAVPPTAETASLIPQQFTLQNWVTVLTDPQLVTGSAATPPLALNVLNSAISIIGVTVISLTLAVFAGYGLARAPQRRSNIATGFLLFTQTVPVIMLIFPIYILFAKFGLLNLGGQIIAASLAFVPMATLFFRAYFTGQGKELEEAASLDGAGPLRTFLQIVLPNAKNAVGAMLAFVLINSWNEFIFALTLILDPAQKTLPPALAQFMTGFEFLGRVAPGGQMVYLLVPIVISAILLALTLRSFTNAVAGGGTKG